MNKRDVGSGPFQRGPMGVCWGGGEDNVGPRHALYSTKKVVSSLQTP